MNLVRQARLEDVHAIREIFLASYGMAYSPRFYDESYLTKLVQCEENLVLVVENLETGQIMGTAAVDFEREAGSDLVGQFGRLAVHPAFRQSGVGNLLMGERIRRVRDRIQVGLVETRLAQTHSLRIAESHGFAAVGFLPLKLRLREPESFVLLARHFGETLGLRKRCPRVIPEVHPLAQLALRNCDVPADAVIDEDALASAPIYRARTSFERERLSVKERAAVLEIEGECLHGTGIFGQAGTCGPTSAGLAQSTPMARVARDSLPKFNVDGREAVYLAARERGRIAGTVGFTVDVHHQAVRVFELIALDFGDVIAFLFSEAERLWTQRLGGAARVVEVNVSAYVPRMQQALGELGFVPVAYIPALTVVGFERLDVVKMFRVAGSVRISTEGLTTQSRTMAELVLSGLQKSETITLM